MKHPLSKKLLSCLFSFGLLASNFNSVYAIDAVAVAEGGTVKSFVANIASELGVESAVGTTVGEQFAAKLGFETLGEVPQSVLDTFRTEMQTAFDKNLSVIQEGQLGEIEPQQMFKGSIQKVGEQQGFTQLERESLTSAFQKTPELVKDIERFKPTFEKLSEIEGSLKLDEGSLSRQAELSSKVEAAERDVQLARRTGEGVEQSQQVLEQAKNELKSLSQTREEGIENLKGEVQELWNKGGSEQELAQKTEQLRRLQTEQEIGQQQNDLEQLRKTREAMKQEETRIKDLKNDLKEVRSKIKAAQAEEAAELSQQESRLTTQIEEAEKNLTQYKINYTNRGLALESIGRLPIRDRVSFYTDRIGIELKEKIFGIGSLVVVGLVFSLGNYITGSIQEAIMAVARANTLEAPQLFGGIWMQIPNGLLTPSDKPAPEAGMYIYVGLDADPKSNSVKRSKHADTKDYLEKAAVFVPVNKFDEWGTIALTDPRFAGYMVHANTGFHFVSGGQGVPGKEVIQFFGEPQAGSESLEIHLEKLQGLVSKGFKGDAYFEYRVEESGYKGEPVLGKRFDKNANKKFVKNLYPGYAQEGGGWGSILNNAVKGLYNGEQFENMLVRPIRPLEPETLKKIGGQDPPADKPYFGFDIYVYETQDTPAIRSLRSNFNNNPDNADLTDHLVEYVVMVDDSNSIVPLEMPHLQGSYNFPVYQLNPRAVKMLSLFDGTFYENGKTRPSGLDVDKILTGYFPQGVDQISAMKKFVQEKLAYGPFMVGDVKLTIDKRLQDKNIPDYNSANSLEDGSDDFLVATQGMNIMSLPGAVTNFVSLVTSRIYNSALIPHDKEHAGKRPVSYTVYKLNDETPPLVVVGGAQPDKYGSVVTRGLRAPLYSLFMDSDINPNNIDQKAVVDREAAQWLATQVGRMKDGNPQWPLPVPVPEQWALTKRGPVMRVGDQDRRIGELLEQKVPDLKKEIENVHTAWKKHMLKLDEKAVERDRGIFVWAKTALRNINLRATSAKDIANGNFVYTSAYYPGEYLVMAQDKDGAQHLGDAFDIAQPQPYAISLSSGNVYDRTTAEPVAVVDEHALLQRVKQAQQGMSDTLEAVIKQTQEHKGRLKHDMHGTAVDFGPYALYLFKEEKDRGQYIYADVSDLRAYQDLAQKGALLDKVSNFYVGIEFKKDAPDVKQNPAMWIFGKPLGDHTQMVLNIVTGVLYSRDGQYQGYIKPFSHSIDNNIDIDKGYLELVFDYLRASWQQAKSKTTMRKALKNRILRLTQSNYKQLLAQKAEIQQAQQIETSRMAPMDQNLLQNIKAQKMIEQVERFARYVKKYRNKYYAVDPQGHHTITDFNVGQPGKDNKLGVVYDIEGNVVVQLRGWMLQTARAYNGVLVRPDGSQELNIVLNHPPVSMKNMIRLNKDVLEKDYEQALSVFNDVQKKFLQNQTDKLREAFAKAAIDVAKKQRIYKSSQAVAELKDEFYFNSANGQFFVKQGDQFIDLINGYEFNEDGTVRLAQYSVLVNQEQPKDIFFVSTDDLGAVVGEYKGKNESYRRLFATDQRSQADSVYYTMGDAKTGDSYTMIHSKQAGSYKLQNEAGKTIGTYVPQSKQVYTPIVYYNTGKNPAKGTMRKEDEQALGAVFLIWSGESALNIQKIYYKRHLIDLKQQGNTFTGSYSENGKKHTISIKKQLVKDGAEIIGHYLSVSDQNVTYNFIYTEGVIQVGTVNTCANEVDSSSIKNLTEVKQCSWQFDVMPDSYGINTLVKALPKRLSGVPQLAQTRVAQQAGGRADIVNANMDKIFYDKTFDRYVYRMASADKEWPYYDINKDGWYVDLNSGVLFNPKLASDGPFPAATLTLSKLFILLDRLEVAVAQVKTEKGIQQGLVYRSPSVVKLEEGRMKVLNQQIVDMAQKDT